MGDEGVEVIEMAVGGAFLPTASGTNSSSRVGDGDAVATFIISVVLGTLGSVVAVVAAAVGVDM